MGAMESGARARASLPPFLPSSLPSFLVPCPAVPRSLPFRSVSFRSAARVLSLPCSDVLCCAVLCCAAQCAPSFLPFFLPSLSCNCSVVYFTYALMQLCSALLCSVVSIVTSLHFLVCL
ncbi:hypothetical protein M758_1G330900 [Ceratodon purpureus]|nr:hypothetical protein M758_1G330900 [Ceratodon purpureus]